MQEGNKEHSADLYNVLIASKRKHQQAIENIDMVLDYIREEQGVSMRVSVIVDNMSLLGNVSYIAQGYIEDIEDEEEEEAGGDIPKWYRLEMKQRGSS